MSKDLFFSIAMLAVIALVWGGWRNLCRAGDKRRGWLMLGAAAVLLVNLVVLMMPMAGH